MLIIFYHLVWLGFELFGVRARVYSQLVQFTLVRKAYGNHHCHNKPPNRKWGWSVDDVMPGRDGLEILRILKKSQLRVEIGQWKQRVEFLPLRHRVEFLRLKDLVKFCRSLTIEILNITRWAARWDGVRLNSQHSMVSKDF